MHRAEASQPLGHRSRKRPLVRQHDAFLPVRQLHDGKYPAPGACIPVDGEGVVVPVERRPLVGPQHTTGAPLPVALGDDLMRVLAWVRLHMFEMRHIEGTAAV